jgi:hypothetical protein
VECTAHEVQLAAEFAMRDRDDADEMPRLDAFDEEFGREPVAIMRRQRRRMRLRFFILLLVLFACVGGVLVLSWPEVQARLLPQLQAALPATRSAAREGSEEQIDRLHREVAALNREVRDLTEARRQAAETIALLRAGQERRPSSGYWYSEQAALTFGIVGRREAGAVAPPPPPRAATAHPKAREPRRRDDALPVPPDPGQ